MKQPLPSIKVKAFAIFKRQTSLLLFIICFLLSSTIPTAYALAFCVTNPWTWANEWQPCEVITSIDSYDPTVVSGGYSSFAFSVYSLDFQEGDPVSVVIYGSGGGYSRVFTGTGPLYTYNFSASVGPINGNEIITACGTSPQMVVACDSRMVQITAPQPQVNINFSLFDKIKNYSVVLFAFMADHNASVRLLAHR